MDKKKAGNSERTAGGRQVDKAYRAGVSKNYAAVIKQLTELVPAAKRKTSRLAALREE